jgi:hypothetical protein
VTFTALTKIGRDTLAIIAAVMSFFATIASDFVGSVRTVVVKVAYQIGRQAGPVGDAEKLVIRTGAPIFVGTIGTVVDSITARRD